MTNDGDVLVFAVTQSNTVRQYLLDKRFSDVGLQVDIRQRGGASSGSGGLVFRHQGHKSCYRFMITGSNGFEFGKEVDNQ